VRPIIVRKVSRILLIYVVDYLIRDNSINRYPLCLQGALATFARGRFAPYANIRSVSVCRAGLFVQISCSVRMIDSPESFPHVSPYGYNYLLIYFRVKLYRESDLWFPTYSH